MKLIYLIIFLDLVVIVSSIKIIFGSYGVFCKALVDHFYPDDILPNPLDKFAERTDARHKMNVLYAVILMSGMISFAIYFLTKLKTP